MSGNRGSSDPTTPPTGGVTDTPATEADDAAPDLSLRTPPGEHSGELPGDNDADAPQGSSQAANAAASEDGQPSQ